MPWIPPSLTLRWGPYSKPDADEQGKVVNAVVAAKNNGLATQQMALEKLKQAGVFEFESAAAVMAALEEEAKKKAEEDAANAQRELDAAIAQIDAKAGAQRPPQVTPGSNARPPGNRGRAQGRQDNPRQGFGGRKP